MDYSPLIKQVEFPSTEVFVQIAEIQIQYVFCVCVFGKRIQKLKLLLLAMSSVTHIFTMAK